MTKNTPSEALVEAMARAMCKTGGLDPDFIMANDGPRWRYYVPLVDAINPLIASHMARKDAELAELRAEIEALRGALEEIANLPGEINPSNYDHDDACELNRQFCYGGSIARAALGASHDADA